MADVLYVDLDALTSKYNAKVDAALKKVEGLGKGVEKTSQNWADSLGNVVKGYIGIEIASRAMNATKDLFLLEERYRSMLMPLRSLTEETGNFGSALFFNQQLADKYGVNILTLGEEYKSLYATAENAGLSLEKTNSIYKSLIVTGSGLRLSNERISLAMRALTQMIDKQTISSEELKQQLAEHIPGAYGLMAKAAKDAGISTTGTTQELAKLLEQGKVASNEVLPFFAKRMEEAFGKNADKMVNTIAGSTQRLKNETTYLIDALDNAKVTSFWASFQNGLADVMKDITNAVKSNSWQDFLMMFSGPTGMGIARSNRILGDASKDWFNNMTKGEQIKKLNELIGKFKEAEKASKGLIAAGMTPNTKYLTDMSNTIKNFSEIMKGDASAGGGGKPPKVFGDGSEAVKDYDMQLTRLSITGKNMIETLKELSFEFQKLNSNANTPEKLKFVHEIMSNRKSWIEQRAKDLGFESIYSVLEKSGKSLQDKYSSLSATLKPVIDQGTKDIATLFGSITKENFSSVSGYINQGFSLLGDTLASGFASIFNKDIKFDFSKMIGGFLSALGDMMMQLGAAELTAGILMNLAAPGSGANKMGAGAGMLAFGAGLKGGGMALSSNSNSGISTSSGSSGGYDYYKNNNWNTKPQQVAYPNAIAVRFENGSLVGALKHEQSKFGY